jgi:hypothetical protein
MRRQGRRFTKQAVVVPFPEASPLDDNWGLDKATL